MYSWQAMRKSISAALLSSCGRALERPGVPATDAPKQRGSCHRPLTSLSAQFPPYYLRSTASPQQALFILNILLIDAYGSCHRIPSGSSGTKNCGRSPTALFHPASRLGLVSSLSGLLDNPMRACARCMNKHLSFRHSCGTAEVFEKKSSTEVCGGSTEAIRCG
ncbi:uncharacterized protein B0H18DRAFT_549098 [Fomitopsis serialis]|uniref:uncharacterized protein n=1 Tax=Fomitopsis serialis TaxID=139415 RepID=UPI0020078ABE|nr:uncharacterized protein B0H18DRAFT_549098 [Neoantrodia serialis]KAH9934254.1 hypothetical protein B0H18DRAFT_549098 [Neoantrodia serialis]